MKFDTFSFVDNLFFCLNITVMMLWLSDIQQQTARIWKSLRIILRINNIPSLIKLIEKIVITLDVKLLLYIETTKLFLVVYKLPVVRSKH